MQYILVQPCAGTSTIYVIIIYIYIYAGPTLYEYKVGTIYIIIIYVCVYIILIGIIGTPC